MGFNNDIHCGNFSSSEIVRLVGSRKVRETYIAERNMERRLGRVLKKDFSSRDTSWGHLMEYWGFGLLPTSYSLISDKTIVSPIVSSWVGSPDAVNNTEPKAICDIKGLQLKALCEMIDAWKKGGITEVRENTESGEKFYWQEVSNACLWGARVGEIILVCPYKSQLDDVRAAASRYDGPDPGRFSWVPFADDEALPYLLDDGDYYKNITVMRFDIPSIDKCKVHDSVVAAAKELKNYSPIPA
jgi:hypothetical protein